MEALLNVILVLIIGGILISVLRLHNNPHYKHFNLIDVLTCRKGKVSRPALMEIGSWILASWGFVVLIQKDKLTEWYMGAYITAFVLRAAHAAYMAGKIKEGGPEK